MPAVSPPAPAAATETTVSWALASTLTSRCADTAAPAAIQACVSFVSTPTSIPAPTPAMPPSATEPATPTWFVRSEASTSTSWSVFSPVVPWLMRAFSPM